MLHVFLLQLILGYKNADNCEMIVKEYTVP